MVGSIRFHLMGPFTVIRDGRELTHTEIGSRKGRTLLKMLLAERGRFVPSDVIAEVLWGDVVPERPERHVATLISRLRTVFGSDLIDGGPAGYRFAGVERFEVDLGTAEELVEEAETRVAAHHWGIARDRAEEARRLLGRGPLLEDEPYAAWTAAPRAAAERLLRRARCCLWLAALELRDWTAAVRSAEDAIEAYPLDEEACRAVMIAHHRAGRPADALAEFERLRANLADQLGVDPATETRALHLAVLREDSTAPPAPAGMAAWEAGISDPSFVDRAEELVWLERQIEGVAAGNTATVLVSGEAGIGKTRFVVEVAEAMRRRGGVVLQACCHQSERSIFGQPIADAIRPAILGMDPDLLRRAIANRSRLAQLVPEVRELVGGEESPPSSELGLRGIFDDLALVLRALSRRQVMLLVLDDLHYAGSSTLDFLHFVAARMEATHILILATVTAHSADDVHWHLGDFAQQLDLGPLSEAGVAELAAHMNGGEHAERVMRMTGGHTRSVVELLRAWTRSNSAAHGLIPQSLRRDVLRRVRSAGVDVQALLRAAAVVGHSFDLPLAAELLGVPLQEAIRRAERAHEARLVVEAGSKFKFANELIREVVYRSTPLPVRIARHRHAASLGASKGRLASV